ncbi:hypothetical protein GA0070616_1025 [Micromonospora nigra]|uniref:Uncharacterized protein n=1 Tax=Micromonospora nigra TaxID=145857 RepID=A0A1C6RH04_9ACTN|nr:hypothetical protein [Micromonospora nigra]SCL16472.1 hypothetical protein GA0070616_1025 [Micromonospora nigra]
MRTLTWTRPGAFVVVALLLATGCGSGSPAGGGGQDPWSDAALRHGLAPLASPEVTLQPDVVVVAGGGESIRSVTADGLTWRIDPRAARADELAPGRVMFVTGRSVGRVLDVRRDDRDLVVTVGPVDVTEVIRDGTFDRQGLTLDTPVVYPAGEPFWADPDDGGTGGGGPLPSGRFGRSRPVPVAEHGDRSGRPGPRSAAGIALPAPPVGVPAGGVGDGGRAIPAGPPVASDRPDRPPPRRGGGGIGTRAGAYSVFASCCTDGVGAHFRYAEAGTRLNGTVTLSFRKPSADFHLAIRGGSVTRAELEISGGFGIRVDVEAGTESGRNIRAEFPIGADFSFPIAQVFGVPLTFTIGQSLRIASAFGATLGTVKGSGEFSLASSLGYGYADGSFGPQVRMNFARKKSLLNSLTGVPVGVMGMVLEHRVRFTVGFNALVLTAGVYFELATRYGMTMGSALGAPYALCRGVGLGVTATFGIGYSILQPVANAINRFLSLFSLPPIKTTGGIHAKAKVYANEEVVPDVRTCGPAPS